MRGLGGLGKLGIMRGLGRMGRLGRMRGWFN